jgi:large repetitive protein
MVNSKRVAACLVGVAIAGVVSRGAIRAASSSGLWTILPDAPTAHQDHSATLLGDGNILVAGGTVSSAIPLAFSSSAELYRPAFNDWLPVGAMLVPRGNHGAALAGNGKVLVAGGDDHVLNFFTEPNCGLGLSLGAIASAEVYDPATLSWTLAPPMSAPRADFDLVRLSDGRVLAAGGADSNGAEIYDPSTNAWTPAGTLRSGHAGAAYTRLPDGRVLVAGGNFGAIWPFCDSNAEIYDPGTNAWTSTDPMSVTRRSATATVVRMADGSRRVLVAGGFDNRSGTVLSTAELYDPATNAWTATGSMDASRFGHTATLLTASGKVLVTGGRNAGGNLPNAELYDPTTGTWMTLNTMTFGRSGHTATQLLIPFVTEVAVIGGMGGTTSAELFQPTPLASTTALSASGSCQPLTLSAFVASATGRGVPTGKVTFRDGATDLGPVPVDAFGRASMTLGALPDGLHDFSAAYSGDDAFNPSTGVLAQSISTPPTLGRTPPIPARALGTSVTLAAPASGGTAPYSYAWDRDGTPLAGGATLTDTPPLGAHTYAVTVTDTLGCSSATGVKPVDVFDYRLVVSPADLTLLRAGLAQDVQATITLVPGSSTEGLPFSAALGHAGVPGDLTGLAGTLPFPQTVGTPATLTLTVQPGSTSLGDFAASLSASAGGGSRSSPLGLHLFDYALSISPPEATSYRSGRSVSFAVTSALTPGSTASAPSALALSASGLPPDATYLLTALPLAGAGSLSIQPGISSSGDFPFALTASSALGARSVNAILHLLVDTTPPVIGLTVAGTTGANGWYVSDVTVGWSVSDPETVTSSTGCAASTVSSDTSGATFTCMATSDGGTTTRSVTIKRDVTPPVLSVPAAIHLPQDRPGGRLVSYTATATDSVDPNPTVTCSPPSGSLFPVGDTIVSCQATNAAGLVSAGSFTVTIESLASQATTLATTVGALANAPGNSLRAKVQQIIDDIAAGHTAQACSDLSTFINEVEAQRDKKITSAEADALVQAALTIKAGLGC